MTKIVGIVGSGMIGRDPFDPHCWSGSSRNLFLALQKANILEDAFGVEASKIERYGLAAKNFSFNKRTLVKKLNLDPLYYKALTHCIQKKINLYSNVNFLQIGAIYDVPSLTNSKTKCFSYHDGNIAEMMRSPIFPKKLLPYAQEAFKWEQKIYNKLDKIFTMSEYLRQSFINDFGISENKVINVGVGTNFEIPTSLPPKNYSNKEILFVGVDFKRKGGENLIKAFDIVRSDHPDAVLHIVGPKNIPDILRQSHSGVIFHGFLSRSNASQRKQFFSLMEKCTLCVLPSLYEPFGIVILESMVYEMPCISTNNWAFPEMIKPGINGELIEPKNVKQLVFLINKYLNNASLCQEHGKNARSFVLQNYSWDKVARKITEEVNV